MCTKKVETIHSIILKNHPSLWSSAPTGETSYGQRRGLGARSGKKITSLGRRARGLTYVNKELRD